MLGQADDSADPNMVCTFGGSALKHTVYGDLVRFTKEDVLNLIAGSGNGRIQR